MHVILSTFQNIKCPCKKTDFNKEINQEGHRVGGIRKFEQVLGFDWQSGGEESFSWQ